jgi:hypothetical protein
MPWVRECADDAAVGESRQALLGERWTQQVAAEPLESGTVIGADGAIGVEVEAFEMRVALADRPDPRSIRGGADAQDGRAGAVAERGPAADGRRTELCEHGGGQNPRRFHEKGTSVSV